MKEIFGVIGDPVSHSLSPQMHEAAFEETGLNAAYHAFHVKPDSLQAAVEGIRGLGIKGINVTIPHKENVMAFLDYIDPLAEEIGAVNTIVNNNGQLSGFNTDGEGYADALLPLLREDLNNVRALVIGAGGAAKGVAITLSKYGLRHVTVTNRTVSKAERLAELCSFFTDASAQRLEKVQSQLTEYNLIINTTSIGMSPDVNSMPLPLDTLSAGTVVSDLIYTPAKTRFLREAEKRGALIQNGLEMFVNQGALAFEKWTGKEAPKEVMKAKVIEQLEG